ncbi:MAG: hypothetical protein M1317_01745 [Candidatus Thermoplasmatota archaeon]|nr:hypothetical protein [Candidatus Thermoplasmatota archaeon]
MIKNNSRENISNYNNKQDVNKDSGEQRVLRYTNDTLKKDLIGKTVEILLVNSTILKGKLLQVGMYDILIEITRNKELTMQNTKMYKPVISQIIVLKSSIITVEVL